MIDSVNILASIGFKHSYFTDNQSVRLKFSPCAASLKVMQKFSFGLHLVDNGFKLFVTTSQDITSYLEYIEKSTGVTTFKINVEPDFPEYYLFTDLPMNWNGTIKYSTSNLSREQNDNVLIPDFTTTNKSNCFAQVEIAFSDLKNAVGTTYAVSFLARKVRWNYYVINRSKVDLVNPFIDAKSKIKFNDPVATNTLFGEEAILFSTGEELIPMKSTPSQKLTLMDEQNGGLTNKKRTKIIFEGLPNPIPSSMSINHVGDEAVFESSMYVYL